MGMYHVGIGLTDWLNIVTKRQHDITMITEKNENTHFNSILRCDHRITKAISLTSKKKKKR